MTSTFKLFPHPSPLALLEDLRVAPRPVFLDEGHFLGALPMLFHQFVGHSLDFRARDEHRSDVTPPFHPQECSQYECAEHQSR